IEFKDTRSSRADGTVSYDVTVTNITDAAILAPLTLLLDPAQYFQGEPVGIATHTNDGLWLINLGTGLPNGQLLPGQSTTAQTVTINNPLNQHLAVGHGIFAIPAANQKPIFDSDPVTVAIAGEQYSYQVAAHDPDGNPITYVLWDAPNGMTLDSETGLLTWA